MSHADNGTSDKNTLALGMGISLSQEDREELKQFGDECLNKAGLKELSEKIKTLKS